MPDWIIWVIVALAVSGVCRRSCGGRRFGRPPLSGRDGFPSGRGDALPDRRGDALPAPSRLRSPRDRPRSGGGGRRRHGRQPPETPLARLQRQFVEGALTLDEYERKLDELERLE